MEGTSGHDDPAGSVHGPGGNTEELHPLQNPVILHAIFTYFNCRDLKNIRMTCQLWEQESLKQWGEVAVLRVFRHRLAPVRSSHVHSMDLEEFTGLLNSPESGWINGGRPYTNFRIADVPMLTLPPYQQLNPRWYFPEYQKLFWNMCGPHIKYLCLQWAVIRLGRMVDGLKWILLKACPNLTELVLSVHDPADDLDTNERIEVGAGTGLQEYSTKLMSIKFEFMDLSEEDARAMLTLVPNLKRLSMEDTDPALLKALTTKMTNGNHIKLHEITLGDRYSPRATHFELLREYVEVAKPNIRTVTLHIHLDEVRESPFHFHRWLGSLGPTLEKLEMTVGTGTKLGDGLNCLTVVDMTGFPFACLRSLKLDFNGDIGNKNAIQFDFRALKGMPNLWELYIDYNKYFTNNFGQLSPDDILKKGRWNWEENRYDEGSPAEGDDPTKMKLDRLEIFHFSGYPSKESLTLFGEWMPNLRNLKTIFNTETYLMSFQMWPNLRKLAMNRESKVCFCCTIIADQELRADKNIEVTYYKLVYRDTPHSGYFGQDVFISAI